MKVQPYLHFDGRCEEALEFYKKALGAQVLHLSRFKDSPMPAQPGLVPPGAENKIMHVTFKVGDAELMASDGDCMGKTAFQGISLSLAVNSAVDAEKCFAALRDGGKEQMPMTETFFAHRFGMVADRFGVSWMVIAMKPMGGA